MVVVVADVLKASVRLREEAGGCGGELGRGMEGKMTLLIRVSKAEPASRLYNLSVHSVNMQLCIRRNKLSSRMRRAKRHDGPPFVTCARIADFVAAS